MTRMSAEQTKAFILQAFDTLFNQRDYAKAAEFWSDKYIQHSAHIPPGREGLFGLVRALPGTLRYENSLIFVDADRAMLHGRFSGHGRPRSWVVADILRLEDGKLAEHWDVIQDEATRDESQSGRPMFGDTFADGAMASTSTEQNKALVLAGIKGVFIDRDPSIVDRLFADNYKQHNPTIPSGKAAIKGLLQQLPADFSYTPGFAAAEGGFVMIHGRYVGWGPKPMIGVDIFRVANGKIAEHWDVLQEEIPAPQSANGNPMFEAP